MIDDPTRESTAEQLSDSHSFLIDSMEWWSGISDLDRLNVLNNPTEDRARILASKISLSIE